MGFTSVNNIPAVLHRSDSTLILRFTSPELTSAFENVLVTSFSKAYPTAEKMSGGKADTLKLVYRINIKKNTANIENLVSNLQQLRDRNLTGVFAANDPIALYEPMDFDDCYVVSGSTTDYCYNKALNLVKARGAWNYTQGLPCVKIGDLEWDFQPHDEITGQIASGTGTGYNLHPVTYVYSSGPGSGYPAHGLSVVGTMVAKGNNGTGLVGLSYESNASYYGGATSSDVDGNPTWSMMSGLLDAAYDGCKVVNCSFYTFYSSTIPPPLIYMDQWNYEQMAVDLVTYNYNVTVVAGAGNNNSGTPTDYFFPASYNNVISVTSVGSQLPVGHYLNANWEDTHRCFHDPMHPEYNTRIHNYNDMVDICAPGYGLQVLGPNNGYTWTGGTSLASPMVAASAALLYSLNPNLQPWEVENYLKNYARDISGVEDNYLFSGGLGAGRLNIDSSVQALIDDQYYCEQPIQAIELYHHSVSPSHLITLPYTCREEIILHLPNATPGYDIDWIIIYNEDQQVFKHGNDVTVTWGQGNEYDFDTGDNYSFCARKVYVMVRQGTDCCFSPYQTFDISCDSGEPPLCGEGRPALVNNNIFKPLEVNKENNLKLYPNPAINILNIEAPVSFEKTEYSIVSSEGRVVTKGLLQKNNNTINIKSLPSGLYLLRTSKGNYKFIKQ